MIVMRVALEVVLLIIITLQILAGLILTLEGSEVSNNFLFGLVTTTTVYLIARSNNEHE